MPKPGFLPNLKSFSPGLMMLLMSLDGSFLVTTSPSFVLPSPLAMVPTIGIAAPILAAVFA
jgi:hypothetical protein